MAKKKFYAIYFVNSGKKTIVDEWVKCQKLIEGHNNLYKSFSTKPEAEEWLSTMKKTTPKKKSSKSEEESVVYKSEEDRQSKVFLHYKDKPVNGEPTNKQIDYLKVLCKRKGLKVNIIGLNRKEAHLLISYLVGEEEKKPSCYKKYISEEC